MYYCYLEKLCPIRQRWTLREVAVDAVDGVLYYSSTVKPRRQNNNKKMKKQKKMNVEATTSTPPLMLRREKEQRRNDAPMDDVESSSPTAATSTQAAHLPRSNYDDDDDVDGDVSASLPLPPTTAHRTCWKKQLRVLNLTYAADRYAIHPGSEGFRESSLLTFCVEGSEETWKASSSSSRANHKSSDHVVLGNDPLVGGSDGGGPTSLVAVHQATSPTNINAKTLDPVLSTANSASLPHERGAALSEPPPRRRPSHGIISWLRRAFTPGSDASPLHHHHHSRGVLATPPRVHPHQQPVDRLSFEELESFGSRMPNEAAENVLNHQLSSEARSVSSMSRHVHTHAAGTRTTSLSSFPPSNSASGVHAAGPDTMMTMGSGVQASSPPQEVAKEVAEEVEEDEPVVLLITFRALNYDAFRLITLRLRESLVRRGLSPPLHRGLPPLDPRNGLQLATVPLHLRWSLRRLNDVLMYSFLRAHVVQVPPHTREVRATCGNLILTPDAAMLVMEDGQCPRWMPWSYLRHIDYALHGSESFVAFRSTTSSSSSSSSTATNTKKMMMVPDFVCIPLYPIYPALTDFEPEEATARVVDVVRRIVASGVANHNNNHNNNHMCDDAPEAATTTTKSVPTRNVSAQYADVFAYIAAMGDGLRWPAARRQARDPPPPPFVLKAVLASSLGIAELNHAHSAAPTPRKPRRERSGAEAMAALHGGLVIGDLIPRAEPTPIHGVALVGSTSPTSYPTPMNCVVGDESRS